MAAFAGVEDEHLLDREADNQTHEQVLDVSNCRLSLGLWDTLDVQLTVLLDVVLTEEGDEVARHMLDQKCKDYGMKFLIWVHRCAIMVVEVEASVVDLVDVDAQCRNDLRLNYSLWVVDDASVLHHVKGINFLNALLFKHLLRDSTNDCVFDPLDGTPLLDEVLLFAILEFGNDAQVVGLVEFDTDWHALNFDELLFVNDPMLAVDLCRGYLVLLFDEGEDDLIDKQAHHLSLKLLALINSHFREARLYHEDYHGAEERDPDCDLHDKPLD